jgi:hypothetical protein
MRDIPIQIEVEIYNGIPCVTHVDPPSGKTAKITIVKDASGRGKRPVGKTPVIDIVMTGGTVKVNPTRTVTVTVFDYDDVLDFQCDDTTLRRRKEGTRPERCLVTQASGQLCYI